MTTPSTTPSRRISGRTIAGVVIAVVMVVWILSNRQRVSISFLLTSATMPLWVALAISGVLGCVVGFLVGRRRYRR